MSVKIDTKTYEKVLSDFVNSGVQEEEEAKFVHRERIKLFRSLGHDDLADMAAKRGHRVYTQKEADKDIARLIKGTKVSMQKIAGFLTKVSQKLKIKTPFLVRPSFTDPKYSGTYPADLLEPIRNATIYLGTSQGDPSFTLFWGGSKFIIDDVLDAGDPDFFHNEEQEGDYFRLVQGIRDPSRMSSTKLIRLYTARPVRDRKLFEGKKEVPANLFLTTKADDAYGYAHDFQNRDVWKVLIQEQYLVETLAVPGKREYQAVSGKKTVPVKSLELVLPSVSTGSLQVEAMSVRFRKQLDPIVQKCWELLDPDKLGKLASKGNLDEGNAPLYEYINDQLVSMFWDQLHLDFYCVPVQRAQDPLIKNNINFDARPLVQYRMYDNAVSGSFDREVGRAHFTRISLFLTGHFIQEMLRQFPNDVGDALYERIVAVLTHELIHFFDWKDQGNAPFAEESYEDKRSVPYRLEMTEMRAYSYATALQIARAGVYNFSFFTKNGTQLKHHRDLLAVLGHHSAALRATNYLLNDIDRSEIENPSRVTTEHIAIFDTLVNEWLAVMKKEGVENVLRPPPSKQGRSPKPTREEVKETVKKLVKHAKEAPVSTVRKGRKIAEKILKQKPIKTKRVRSKKLTYLTDRDIKEAYEKATTSKERSHLMKLMIAFGKGKKIKSSELKMASNIKTAARRNPEINKGNRVRYWADQLVSHKPMLSGPLVLVRLTDQPQATFNPDARYQTTPVGVYFYDLLEIIETPSWVRLGAERPYAVVAKLKPSAKVLEVGEYPKKQYSKQDFVRDIVGVIKFTKKNYPKEIESGDKRVGLWYDNMQRWRGGKHLPHSSNLAGTLYKVVKAGVLYLSGNTPIQLTRIFRSLGYDAIHDEGEGVIHGYEPAQCVVLNPRVIKVIDVIKKPMLKNSYFAFEITKADKDRVTRRREESGLYPLQKTGASKDVGFVKQESGKKYWGNAGSGLLFITDLRMLLLLRSQFVAVPNTWGIPGGAIKETDGKLGDAYRAALKETKEETGLSTLPKFKVVGKFEFKDGNFTFTTFICKVDKEFAPKVLDWENNDYDWVTYPQAMALKLHPGVRLLLKEKAGLLSKLKVGAVELNASITESNVAKEPYETTWKEFSEDVYPKAKSGYDVLYTATDTKNLKTILKQGLRTDKATGREAPKGMLWATTGAQDYSTNKGLVAFQVPKDAGWVSKVNDNQRTIHRNIAPKDILRVYDVWKHPSFMKSSKNLTARQDALVERFKTRKHYLKIYHQLYIKEALERGDRVPANVLREYPDIKNMTIKEIVKAGKLLTAQTITAGIPKTDIPYKLHFQHNTESAPNRGSLYQQHIEPAGMYVIAVPKNAPHFPGHTYGTASLRKPLVLPVNKKPDAGKLYDENSWKQVLYDTFNKKGRALSRALIKDGYDGILTHHKGELSECVILDSRNVVFDTEED